MRQGQGGGGRQSWVLERRKEPGEEEGGRKSVEVCVFLAGQGRKGKAYLPNMPCLCSSCGKWKAEGKDERQKGPACLDTKYHWDSSPSVQKQPGSQPRSPGQHHGPDRMGWVNQGP